MLIIGIGRKSKAKPKATPLAILFGESDKFTIFYKYIKLII